MYMVFLQYVYVYAPKTFEFMPDNYFDYATASLVYIYYDNKIDEHPGFRF